MKVDLHMSFHGRHGASPEQEIRGRYLTGRPGAEQTRQWDAAPSRDPLSSVLAGKSEVPETILGGRGSPVPQNTSLPPPGVSALEDAPVGETPNFVDAWATSLANLNPANRGDLSLWS